MARPAFPAGGGRGRVRSLHAPRNWLCSRRAVTPPTNPDAEKNSISEMPAGTAVLVASAQAHFVHQEYDAAEADYLKILDRDQNNGIALANLATISIRRVPRVELGGGGGLRGATETPQLIATSLACRSIRTTAWKAPPRRSSRDLELGR